MLKDLLFKELADLENAVNLLEFSIIKYKGFDVKKKYSQDELEYFDALSFRYEKSIELLLNFMKGLEIFLFSKTGDTLRDRLLNMEKIKIIDGIDFWIEARILRNKIAHAYLSEQLKDIYESIFNNSKIIFKTLEKINKYLKDKIK